MPRLVRAREVKDSPSLSHPAGCAGDGMHWPVGPEGVQNSATGPQEEPKKGAAFKGRAEAEPQSSIREICIQGDISMPSLVYCTQAVFQQVETMVMGRALGKWTRMTRWRGWRHWFAWNLGWVRLSWAQCLEGLACLCPRASLSCLTVLGHSLRWPPHLLLGKNYGLFLSSVLSAAWTLTRGETFLPALSQLFLKGTEEE